MDFLSKFIDQHGYSPSYEEIAAGLGLASLATVHKHVQALEAKQYLRRSYNHSRSLEIGDRYFAEERARRSQGVPQSVPLLGRIAAGSPVEAIPNPETLHFADFVGAPNTYALEVRGESMIDDHICSGDFVWSNKLTQLRMATSSSPSWTEPTLRSSATMPNPTVASGCSPPIQP
jgi:repressor LexA